MFGIQNFIPRLIEYLSKVVTITLVFERLVNDIFVLHQEEISKSYSLDNIVKKIFIFFAEKKNFQDHFFFHNRHTARLLASQ